jgi:L-amino acid N-acyltransferase YncA
MTTTLIRQALPTEWDALAALLTTAQLPLDGAHELADRFLVAEAAGELLGCAVVESFGSAGLLRSVAVVPTRRSRGVGHALVTDLIASSRNGGMQALYLLTTTADRYFPRLGFEVIDRADVPKAVRASVEFRSACPASATVMRLDLSRAPAPQAGTAVRVRDAVAADAASIAAIYNIGIREGTSTFEARERTPDEVTRWLGDPHFPVLVAQRNGEVMGWIAASSYRARECYAGIAEFSVYVDPVMRGRGVGDALTSAFLERCAQVGHWKVLSRVFPTNLASRALCRRHGFREVGVYRRHARQDGQWRDVIIVERLVGEAASLS